MVQREGQGVVFQRGGYADIIKHMFYRKASHEKEHRQTCEGVEPSCRNKYRCVVLVSHERAQVLHTEQDKGKTKEKQAKWSETGIRH